MGKSLVSCFFETQCRYRTADIARQSFARSREHYSRAPVSINPSQFLASTYLS